jgi:hypothetical protein
MDSVVFFQAGVAFPQPSSMRRSLRSLALNAVQMYTEPEQASHFTSMGSVLSFHTRAWLDWVSRRPYQIQCSFMGKVVDECLPVILVKRKILSRPMMTDMGVRYHPCHDSFGSLASLVPSHFWNKRGIPTLMDTQSIAKIQVYANDHHITQMVLDRENWFVEMVWPFKNIYRLGLGASRQAKIAFSRALVWWDDDDEDAEEESYKSSKYSCGEGLALAIMSLL